MLGGRLVRHEVDRRDLPASARAAARRRLSRRGNQEATIATRRSPDAGRRDARGLQGRRRRSRAWRFQGKIIVREAAQKTDAQQLNRNLLLGRRAVDRHQARARDLADDVKCSHGATVGDLDETALFYLRARGIPDAEARRMLIEAFCASDRAGRGPGRARTSAAPAGRAACPAGGVGCRLSASRKAAIARARSAHDQARLPDLRTTIPAWSFSIPAPARRSRAGDRRHRRVLSHRLRQRASRRLSAQRALDRAVRGGAREGARLPQCRRRPRDRLRARRHRGDQPRRP